ncbi:ergothioneine biosynthesis protein EgtB [Actinomycetospora sp. NBRC 106378]|uniref:ergothioneine biosynthesis protein EgtB n=1 Tax=Actinomycetospora sp. NBRC 106378 TaxID=3032208 RepID=UPI0024A394FA|nr:ergothioneine biosynthesis protein EgtB [Actinomycetospora sp. NBRC 106378]GLZ52339.1 hercynine oxygenase [Actinomycetospora sp. NBRC 106378]
MTRYPDDLRARLAEELATARRRTQALTDAVDDVELTRQHSPLMSPLHWDVAHIANMEDFWLVRRATPGDGVTPGVREDVDHLYDAFTNPRAGRPQLPLLDPVEARAYGATVRERTLEILDEAGSDGRALLEDGFVYGMIAQHEQQHVETMLATHQLRVGPKALHAPAPPASGLADELRGAEVFHPGGRFTMGVDATGADVYALDNERPAHPVDVEPFFLGAAPVTNGEYVRFLDDGGYTRRELWSDAGWEQITADGWSAPMTWEKVDGAWHRTSFGERQAIADVADQPVLHVCFHEADAYARWAGKRLPTEVEWEYAARFDPASGETRRFPWGDDDPTPERANLDQRHLQPAPIGAYPQGASPLGVHQLVGDVWEWLDSGFEGYPGFAPFPYKEYSEVFFGGDFRMLRGSSFGVGAINARTTFRNWDLPIRRQIFSGFRLARRA